jgi:hypothetical protein
LKYAFENPILSKCSGQKLRSVCPITITAKDMDDLILPVDAFIRSIGVNRSVPHALFLGAGASITSGVPSASMCIWEWKRDIFLTNNPGLEDQFSELSLPSVKERIQRWLDRKGDYPANGSDEEYGFYIRSCFPISDNRRAYFQEKVRSAKPHVGYHLLCFLTEAEIIRSVWTTNFDGLSARAAANFAITPIEVGIDCQERLPRQPKKGELLCVSLHGDYRYDPLKNTEEELQQQEAQLRRALIETTRDTSLIVIGYSGRDQSIMEALTAAYSQNGAAPLYWCGFGHEIPQSIQLLIETARANGRIAFFVPTDGFDDVMSRLARHCLSPMQREKATTTLAQATEAAKAQRTPFTIDDAPVAAIIKSNAFAVECPSEAFAFDLKEWPKEKVWAWIKGRTKRHNILAVPFRKVLAFGTLDNIKDAFSDNIARTIARVPIGDDDTRHADGAVVCLLRRALINAIATKVSLETDGDDSLWETEKFDSSPCSDGSTTRSSTKKSSIGESFYSRMQRKPHSSTPQPAPPRFALRFDVHQSSPKSATSPEASRCQLTIAFVHCYSNLGSSCPNRS